MDTQEVPIGVISLISQPLCGAINKKLMSLGYKNLDTFEYNELRHAKRDRLNRVFVFPLSQIKRMQGAVQSAFELVKEKTLFGIVQALENDLNMGLLGYCNEFVRFALRHTKAKGEKLRTIYFLGFIHYCTRNRKATLWWAARQKNPDFGEAFKIFVR